MGSRGKLLHSTIFETLRDRIVHGEYPPGTGLSEKDLCREFKVSRMPLREALAKLEDMKLVTIIPRFGTNVAPIDINEIRCAFEVKLKLEGLAVELAAGRIDSEGLTALADVIGQVAQLTPAPAPSSDRARSTVPSHHPSGGAQPDFGRISG
jgi:DNA-binding GntR family transcriptional regulator